MSLPHLLLGMLAEPSSGYDLKKAFGQSIRHFWSAELSQIYPALGRLEDQGLLRSEQVESAKGPPRRVYHRTEAGRRALVEWLDGGPAYGQERQGYLSQVFFLEAIPIDRRIWFMERLKAGFEDHLAELHEIEDAWSADPRYPDDLPDEDFYPQLTLRLGLMKIGAIVTWCDESLARMRKRASGAGGEATGCGVTPAGWAAPGGEATVPADAHEADPD